jgi:hypothetical protein
MSWGIYDMKAGLVKDCMRKRKFSGSVTIIGDEVVQLAQMLTHYDDFVELCDDEEIRCELVIEDFSLVPGSHTPGKEGISPVRYAWVLVGYLWARDKSLAPEVIWQLPGVGMRYNTRQMLTNWDAWIVGKEHERAAFAHAGARLHRILK